MSIGKWKKNPRYVELRAAGHSHMGALNHLRLKKPPIPPLGIDCACGHSIEEHRRDPRSTACTVCYCIAFEDNS